MNGFVEQHAEQVRLAAERIHGRVRRTPTLTTDLDAEVRLKPECFQVTGSFKPRGAFNAILSLVARGDRPPGVIAVSSGNHAQAVALAASTVGLPALILIPEDANPAKVAATRALGAEVIQEGITFANREQRLREVMAERGFVLVHPFDDWDVIHGQGTAVRELLHDEPELDVVATPVGGGGLLAGSAISAKSHRPGLKVVGSFTTYNLFNSSNADPTLIGKVPTNTPRQLASGWADYTFQDGILRGFGFGGTFVLDGSMLIDEVRKPTAEFAPESRGTIPASDTE